MPLSMYGNTNPKGLEPFQIESTLAPLAAGGNQAEAQMLLNQYQQQRVASTNLYGEDLAQQHQAYYDQLANQMAQARIKEVPNLLKTPGGASLLGPGGIPGIGMGTDPSVMQDAINRANASTAAENLQKTMTGLNQGSQGGYGVTPAVASGVTGLPVSGAAGPALVQAATIRGNAELAAARIKAAASGNTGPTESMPVPNAFGGQSNLSFPKSWTEQQKQDYVTTHFGLKPVNTTGLPPAPTDQTQPTVPPPTTTPAPTVAPAQTTSGPPQNAAAGNAALQKSVLANLDKMPPAARTDIMGAAAKNGNMPVVGTDAQGPFAQGASGQKYR